MADRAAGPDLEPDDILGDQAPPAKRKSRRDGGLAGAALPEEDDGAARRLHGARVKHEIPLVRHGKRNHLVHEQVAQGTLWHTGLGRRRNASRTGPNQETGIFRKIKMDSGRGVPGDEPQRALVFRVRLDPMDSGLIERGTAGAADPPFRRLVLRFGGKRKRNLAEKSQSVTAVESARRCRFAGQALIIADRAFKAPDRAAAPLGCMM